jgi:hypothetical protein
MLKPRSTVMKDATDRVITDPEELIEVFESFDAEEQITMVQERVQELKILVEVLSEEADVPPMGMDIVNEARKDLKKAEESLDRLYDIYLGVGAKAHVEAGPDSPLGEAITGDYLGWGARKPKDIDRHGAGIDIPALLETAEASEKIKELTKIANELDQRGLREEADALDKILKAAWEEADDVTGGHEEPEAVGITSTQKVWVVTYEIPYEGGTVAGIFSTEQLAKEAIDAADDDMISGHTYDYEDYEVDQPIDL